MGMAIFREIEPLREQVRRWRTKELLAIGVVPTMGSLHEGHMSLIERSAAENDRTIVTIFVNPTQFGPGEDYDHYPRDFRRDTDLCRAAGVHAVFSPGPSVMYPQGYSVKVEVPALSEGLCGRARPTHFQGVCAVVLKLLNITEPRRAYFGLKDAQQFFILRRMAKDLNLDVEMVPCPIVREPDGLAKSSRNAYLSPEERAAAVVLSRALGAAKASLESGQRSAKVVLGLIKAAVGAEAMASLEYVEAVDTERLQPVRRVDGETLFALAARVGATRLIDNIIFDPGKAI